MLLWDNTKLGRSLFAVPARTVQENGSRKLSLDIWWHLNPVWFRWFNGVMDPSTRMCLWRFRIEPRVEVDNLFLTLVTQQRRPSPGHDNNAVDCGSRCRASSSMLRPAPSPIHRYEQYDEQHSCPALCSREPSWIRHITKETSAPNAELGQLTTAHVLPGTWLFRVRRQSTTLRHDRTESNGRWLFLLGFIPQ